MLTEQLPAPFAPAGWYADPFVAGGQRWWDGRWWTAHTAVRRIVAEPAPTFPAFVGLVAIAILYASLIVERLVLLSTGVTDTMHAGPLLALVVTLAYGPSVAFSLYAALRWGTKGPIDALGARFRAADLGWGPLTWLVLFIGQIALGLFIRATHMPSASNLPKVGEGRLAGSSFAMMVFVGVVIAPVAEELVFRGVVLRAFRSRLPLAAAAIAQGAFFAVAHVQPAFGWGNAGLVLILLWAGTGLGFAASWFKRIWPGIFAHALINSVAFVVLYGQTYWHWRLNT